MLRKSRKQLTTRFLHRTILFFTSFSVGLTLFFVFGNMQHFMDSTQSMILTVLSGTSLVTVLIALILLVLEGILFLKKMKKLYLVMLFVTCLCLVFGVIVSILAHFILLLSRGL